ncbi:glycosyltransferase [Frankia sp. CNm7]|uniref:Glycosyltransferase n=1 Tax=Frankia nepalensis TaxID=1836974 RepID=A0A937UW66_9ACTN|nr:glycosyltransferase [Frankia nepalensis]MBL7494974.1 glycosyltransferase [Frankia nepalensis]MBL7514597.1 glycosyltransferase [Frankia nepalensis]MBL7523833.1 glycosyltransferase [Frankia nepalensis]MBL7633076.1 glycosyltransferase [Frankia nepalensis]
MPLRYGFLSTYFPTQCGLATFTAALFDELTSAAPGASSGVVRLLDAPAEPGRRPAAVVGDLVAGTPGGPRRAARLLNGFDIAVVQHEYGVYGGPDGDEVIEVLDHLEVPVVVVLHTVLASPSRHQRAVLEALIASADAVVVMTETARARLVSGYRVRPHQVSVIPHGAADNRRAAPARSARPTILTWGLLGPGKGIEWGIAAMAELAHLDPAPRYLVAGQTHPKVLAREGEAYRDSLAALAGRLGVADSVTFDDRYLDSGPLAELVSGADVVLLPYDSVDQVTSGILIEAVAALRPVVATRFPHAVELLGDGAGLLVRHGDAAAIAAALRAVLTDDAVARGLTSAAAAHAPDLLWPTVARCYRRLAAELVAGAWRSPSAVSASQRALATVPMPRSPATTR